jgi:ribokinase
MKHGHIVVLGSVNTDLVLRCAALPVAGQTVRGEDFRCMPGGKGANQAVAAARLGATVRFIGAVGADEFGRGARANLEREGIDTRHLREVSGVATGTAIILVDASSGQNCIALSEGANAHVDVDLVEAAAAEIRTASLLICQLETPLPATRRAAELAHEAGVPVLLNPAPAAPLDAGLLTLVSWLVPNESEAMLLSRLPAHGAFQPEQVLDALHAAGARSVLVTLGERGVLHGERGCGERGNGERGNGESGHGESAYAKGADGDGEHGEGEDGEDGRSEGPARTYYRAHATRAVDTSGAGDAFIGALGAALVAGRPLAAAIDFAQRAASLSVARPGAMASLPYAAELP